MKAEDVQGRRGKIAVAIVIATSCWALTGVGAVEKAKPSDGPVPLTVPKATCGPNDHPETDLQ